MNKLILFLGLSFILMLVLAAPALASDHLFNATHAANDAASAHRGFANPVASNPSGVSGPAAAPATVPGEGDPKVGVDQETPAVNLALVSVRSGGHGNPIP